MMRVSITMAVLLGTMSVADAGRGGGWGDGARDHRDSDSGSSGGTVRDHRSSDSDSGSSSSGGTVRDHRGSDSSSDSSDSSADTSVNITSGAAAPTGCFETSDVVGYRRCSRFGKWARATRFPEIAIELGTHVRQFGSERAAAWAQYGDQASAMAAAQAGGRDIASTAALRIGFGVGRGIYTLGEIELGGIAASNGSTMHSTDASVALRTSMFLGTLAVGGMRMHSRQGALSIEGAGGARFIGYELEGLRSQSDGNDTAVVVPVFEARVRAEAFLSPWVTFSGVAGANVLARGDWMAGFFLGIHSRAFAGGR